MSDALLNLTKGTWSTVLARFAGIGLAVGVAVWILVKHKLIYAIIRTLPRDSKALYRLIKVFLRLGYLERRNFTIGDAFNQVVAKNPKKVLLLYEDQEWTAEQINKLSNQIANFFQQKGYKKGDTVALFMENTPEYLSIWLGLSKIGCITSLVNYNLRLQPLKHCFEAVNSKGIIYNPALTPALQELLDMGDILDIPLFCLGHDSEDPLKNSAVDLTRELKGVSEREPVVPDKLGFSDTLFYIYTSGTTGLPKAAIIKHSRLFFASVGNFYMHGLRTDEVLYTSLPLYHGSGVMLGGGNVLCFGITMVVRKKFSASNFWKDCIRYNVTAAQYIGEICRYLISQPPSPLDKSHKVRIMFGNGLRAEIWGDFVKRFNIPQIDELYGATEGNCNMTNIDNKLGAVGFVPLHFHWIIPIRLIKVDEETGQPIRNKKTGFVTQCDYNEPGELIGRIQRNHPIRDYEGYADKSSSKDKVLENAFTNGDKWFRSGDILVMDNLGYFYFKDRKGDTFRWKGENCSTTEVEAVLSTVCGQTDAVVFGVEVPGAEGRAGMAVISDPDGSLNMENISTGVCKSLPAYARPMFVRVAQNIDMTGTYKLQKLNYQKQGYDVTKVKDKVFFLKGNKYVVLDPSLYQDIASGKLRL